MKLNEANFFYSETTEAKLFLKQNFRNKTLFLAKRSETFFVVSRNCFCFAKFCFEAKFFKAKLRLIPLGTVLSTLITFSLSFFRTLNGRWPLTHSDPRAEPSQRTIGWKKDVTQVMWKVTEQFVWRRNVVVFRIQSEWETMENFRLRS